ncbi:hypothetical protein P280DRAFT_491464 [Massarina eburnea CBS 473.64]|uniref:Uncharacterized protein n=1 Tax=Massarina eburnea CBS 473.64 TaxID=1395130 RepID=A0A6A6RVJ7_9PLEO|nr:hypothetical protein P280DRAFT_491464 [Massarina eburnea CBS 473.64]
MYGSVSTLSKFARRVLLLKLSDSSLYGGTSASGLDLWTLRKQGDLDVADTLLRPPPSSASATFTRSATAYSGLDPQSELQSPGPHGSPRLGHQRSFTGTFLDNSQPLISRANTNLQQHTSRPSSPTKSHASFISSRSVAESTASQPKIRAGAKGLSDWFNGASGQVNVGIGSQSPSPHESDDSYDSEDDSEDDYEDEGAMIGGIFNRKPALTRSPSEIERQNQGPAAAKPPPPSKRTSTAASRFAWLLNTQKSAVPAPAPSPTFHDPDDELLNLNISQALFPHGPVDPLAPSSFNDLLSTAEALISRYQTSYRQLSTSFVDVRAEQSAQDDELDEADTRIRHLKSQMEMMAARAADQDEQMRRLMEDLMFEKKAREEEEAARQRLSVRNDTCCEHGLLSPRRRNRVSNSDVSVDSGFESEVENDGASIFSHTMSPTTEHSSVPDTDDRETTPKGNRLQPIQRESIYDKVRNGTAGPEKITWGCSNCEGGSQSSVWGRLAREREENSTLRRRVGDLEDAVDNALHVVDGPWGM